jgi:nucleotide-binding universal stress UspA family protein
MKILLPVDGSELSLKAVRVAVNLLQQGLSGSLVIANVQEPATLYEMVVAPDGEVLQRVSTAAGIDALEKAEALLMAEAVVYEREIATGDPAHTIIDIGERFACDMIIMGARGVSAMRSALLGSVSNEVLHAAQVPVMIVKLDED